MSNEKDLKNPKVVSRDEWLRARKELLKAEKELTHRSDDVARQRQALPWVRIDKDYRFETDKGIVTLKDLFRGRSQLHHVSFHVWARGPPPGVRTARPLRTVSTEFSCTWLITTSCFGQYRGGRSQNCRPTSGEWAGVFRGLHRSEVISIMTSTFRSPKSSSAPGTSITITRRLEYFTCRRYQGGARSRRG